jgi:hypothetical protein
MNENIGDILLETKRCSMLQEDNIIEWDITAQSLDLFFIWCVEDISRQRGIKDRVKDSLGHQVDTRGRIHLKD